MPLVSVLLPLHNARPYVGAAVQSVLGQTLGDLELIVVDDASTDGSAEVVRSEFGHDKRVKILCSSANAGPGQARNLGLRHARGEWIAVLDADDVYAPSRLEILTDAAAKTAADLMADNQYLFRHHPREPFGLLVPRSNPTIRAISLPEFLNHNLPGRGFGYGLLKPLIRRKFLVDGNIFYSEHRFGEDFIFYSQCFASGCRYFLLNAPLYYYRYGMAGHSTRHVPDRYRLLLEGNEVVRDMLATDPSVGGILDERARLIKRAARYEAIHVPLRERRVKEALARLVRDTAIAPFLLYRIFRALAFRASGSWDLAGW